MKISKLINDSDNVLVVIDETVANELVSYIDGSGDEVVLTAKETIPKFHKLARFDIYKGDHIIKYGEHIGVAANNIKQGEHVHVHNVLSVREEL